MKIILPLKNERDARITNQINYTLNWLLRPAGSQISSAGRAQPTPPIAQCSGGGGLPPSLQMQAEVLELDIQGLMAPGQQVSAFAFVFVVRLVPGRALLLGGQLGFELLDPRLECGNHIGHRQAAWGPYGQRFVL